MHIQRIMLLPRVVLAMLSTFMPWVVTPGIPSSDGTPGAGWITFGIYAVILVLIVFGRWTNRMDMYSFTCASMLAILCSVYSIILMAQIKEGDINDPSQTATTPGFGLWVLMLMGFLFPVVGFIF